MRKAPVLDSGGGRLLPSLLRLVLPPLALLLTLSGLLFLQIHHLLEQSRRVEHAGEVLTHGNALYRRAVDEEIGVRGYLLTGHDAFLEKYRDSSAKVITEFQALHALLVGAPQEAQLMQRMHEEHAEWERETEAVIETRAAGDTAPQSTSNLLYRKQRLDRIRAGFEAFLQDAEVVRQSYINATQRQTRVSLGAGAVVFMLIAAGITLGTRRRLLDVSASYQHATKAEARLRGLWESNIVGVMYANIAGDVTEANDYVLRMLGYTREEVLAGRVRWSEITPPEFASIEAEHIAESLRKGSCSPYEKAYIAKDGRVVPVLLGYALLHGSRTEYIAFVLDLTERKRAEQALAEQHAITRTITENAAAALFMQDDRGYCIFMNPSAEAMTGLSFEEIQKRPLHDVLHPVRPDGRPFPAAECLIHTQLGKTRVRGREDVFLRKSGERFPVLCSASPIMHDGRQVATVLEARDITEQKRIEGERERLLDSERAARSAAEHEARIRDEFLMTLSHELRTPLNAVLGWTSILRKGPIDAASTTRALEVIERNARAEAQLVEDLLDVSRIASGKLRLDVQRVDLPEVVELAGNSSRPAAEAKRIRLEMNLDRGAGAVMADPARIQQIVWNLLSNAIKFTPSGGRVSVGLRRVGASAEIVVSDSGQGIAKDFLPQVFERFRQADSSTTRRHAGLGLGLSLVRHLVELHGGCVRVESEGEGRGATFTVSLPSAAIDQDRVEAPAAQAPHESLKGVRVLVVDDEKDTRDLVRRLLTDCDADVLAVDSAREALEEVQRFQPHVLLSDIGMPQQDGYQLLRALRSRGTEQGGRIPAAALTAFARPEDRLRALEAGYQIHIAKPVNACELIATVARLAHRPAA